MGMPFHRICPLSGTMQPAISLISVLLPQPLPPRVPALLAFMEYYGDFVNRLLQISDILIQRGEQEASVKRLDEIMELRSPERPCGLEHFVP